MEKLRKIAILSLIAMAATIGSAAAQDVRVSDGADGSGVRVSGGEDEWLEVIAPGFDSVVGNPVEYRRVLDKFSAAVVRLSTRDCAIAYYGFSMQPGFSPVVPGEEDMQRAIMAEDYVTAYSLGVQILERAPVNLTALYWTLYAATETRQPWEVRNALRGQYNSITYIIAIGGDGLSPETAFKVVWPGDMYTYTMLELGLTIGDGYLWDDRWTEFEITRNGMTPDRMVAGGVASGGPGGPGAKFAGESIFFELWRGND